MNTLLTLDYELFFGDHSGTPQRSMIGATERLLAVLDEYEAKAVFFVDACYLLRLREYSCLFPRLKHDYRQLVRQIQKMESEGHQIQLHIHPHWADSYYNGIRWEMVTRRYRLHDWRHEEVLQIVSRATAELNRHLVNPVFAFRAGGWCIQPFERVREALVENGIYVDSTVFAGGRSQSDTHSFDFSAAPARDSWQFDGDPCVPEEGGCFTEIPISSSCVSPAFYWRLALTRLFGDKQRHGTFGDGVPIKNSRAGLLRLMTRKSHAAVSIDGYKSSLLLQAYRQAVNEQRQYFVAMGHPKSLSEFSLQNIRQWLGEVYGAGHTLQIFDPLPVASRRLSIRELLKDAV
ncbi:polysaccharide deacetylase family protein [Microbulbifer hainanensis]|uniref:polysaccharide deacetylase family protein n=1 Tax=Microbulbifer hainanensis TaxID=2735675 RepID=UPI001866835A|nr:polysaccharide deacetylase family protein [Microbulbifer hainanensis]